MFRVLVFLLLVGCQTTQQKNWSLVQDRALKLAPFSQWKATECDVDVELTQPALARYREMFPEEAKAISGSTLHYKWRARKSLCEVTSSETSPLVKNHKAFMESALCMLVQTHFVNSPFTGLKVHPDDVVDADGWVQLRTTEVDDLGIFLNRDDFKIQTKTKTRGTLVAAYAPIDSEWLPESVRLNTPSSALVVDGIRYSGERIGTRRTLDSLWISVGDQRPLQHSHLQFKNCHQD